MNAGNPPVLPMALTPVCGLCLQPQMNGTGRIVLCKNCRCGFHEHCIFEKMSVSSHFDYGNWLCFVCSSF